MGRPVVLSNGQLFVGLNEQGLVHDFYFPYVGLDNLTNARSLPHKIGVWVNGEFSWVSHDEWEISINYREQSLISLISMRSQKLGINLLFEDFVDTQHNALIRRCTIENAGTERREVRLFMHQVFEISRTGRADTAMYVPDDDYILDYKGRCCLLISGRIVGGGGPDQFAIGNIGIEGKDGTWRDAEDGELSNNPIEHGGVDSVLRFRMDIEAHESAKVDYWIVGANSQSDAQVIHTWLKYHSIDTQLDNTQHHYKLWMSAAQDKLQKIPEQYRELVTKSLLIIKAHCDKRGSVLASGDSSIFNYGRDYYCYCWPRDAAYALWPLIRLGMYEEARSFFGFARDTMHLDGYLMHKYQPDRSIGSTWHPLLHNNRKELAIQEDETAIVLYMIGEYYHATKDRDFVEEYFDSFIVKAANFMCGFIDDQVNLPHASYDLWEEKFLSTTYSISTVVAGLESAVTLAEAVGQTEATSRWRNCVGRIKDSFDLLYHPDGYFRKGYLLEPDGNISFDDTVDISSMYGPFMFMRMNPKDSRLQKTVATIEDSLLDNSPAGGAIRYEHDNYFRTKQQYKGNPWIVASLWLAQYYVADGKTQQAKDLLDWAAARRETSGAFGEQFDPDTGYNLGVMPLVWSHAEFINTVLDLYDIQ